MCAIAGIAEPNPELIGEMKHALSHRGPDGTGTFTDATVSLGHNRLSIIDLSPAGNQPMAAGPLQLVFNGEIYNFKELRSQLESEGESFASHSDTEVILRGYIRHGTAFFSRLRGMWAFALYDAPAHKLILVRDPFGIKPLYYYKKGKKFAFASELRGLMPVARLWGAQDDIAAHCLYFFYGYMPAPYTPFAEVRKVNPGEVMVYDLADRTLSAEAPVRPFETEPAPVYANLADALDDSIAAHFVADVPVGIFYSGGIDSTLLLARARRLGFDPKAFFMRIPNRLDNDYALRAAEIIGVAPTVIDFDEDSAINMFEQSMENLDEPFADSSYVPTSMLSREVSKSHKVVLSGEGGDELFGGYHRHKHLLFLRQGMKLMPTRLFSNRLRRAIEAKINRDPIAAYLEFVRIDDGLLSRLDARAALEHNLARAADELPFTLDQVQYLPDDLLVKIDRSMMHYGLEGRVPFLDRKLFSYVRTIPASERQGDSGKEMLKRLLREYLPIELVDRPKQGFSFPLHLLRNLPQHYITEAAAAAEANPHLVPFTKGQLRTLQKHPQLMYALLVWAQWRKRNEL